MINKSIYESERLLIRQKIVEFILSAFTLACRKSYYIFEKFFELIHKIKKCIYQNFISIDVIYISSLI